VHGSDGERIPVEINARTVELDDRQLFLGIFRDVTERIERERTLARENERIREIAGIVSHDLRNPLQVALGNVELARTTGDEAHLDATVDALERMDALVEDTLALTRQGMQTERAESVDLGEIARRSWRNTPTADAELRVERDDPYEISAEPNRLEQLLENLFRNAVEHGGRDVTVGVGEHGDGFYVEDDGRGIPDDERDRVFEPGYTTADDGTGLGLNIVRRVAEAHGWRVALDDGPDGGVRVEIAGVDSDVA
jgi:signal transduction histidine kinase